MAQQKVRGRKTSDKPGDFVSSAGHADVEQERNRVEQRERHHRQQRAAGEPLQLLAQQRRVGAL